MISMDTFQSELEDWQARFYSNESYPSKAVTVTLPSQKRVAHFEFSGAPSVYAMRQTARERTYGREPKMPDIFVGRSLRGRALSQFYLVRSIEGNPMGLSLVSVVSLFFGPLVRNHREERRARTFAEGLMAHWQAFEPTSQPPDEVTEVTSPDRRITVVYDPELGNDNSPPQPPFNLRVYRKGDEYTGRFSRF